MVSDKVDTEDMEVKVDDVAIAETTKIAPPPPTGGDPSQLSYSTIKGSWLYEDIDSDKLYEFNNVTRDWTCIEDVEEGTGELESKKQSQERKRRRQEALKERQNTKKTKTPPPNKAIYVSGLPDSAKDEDLVEIFQRYGVLAEDVHTGKKKARIYMDEQGKGKGDGLVVFFKPESVILAVDMLHDQQVFVGDKMVTLGVQPAVFDRPKREKESAHVPGDKDKQPVSEETEETTQGPSYSEAEKAKARKKYTQLQQRLNDWDDNDLPSQESSTTVGASKNSSAAKTVTLKNVFTLQELQDDPDAEMDIKEDIYTGCGAIGTVKNVTLYDLEPSGVVCVRFERASDATACVERMNGRFFGGQKLEAYIDYEGTKWKKSRDKNGDNEEEEKKRLDRFGQWLEE